jgi:uncharacterized protein (TIGR02588 family)
MVVVGHSRQDEHRRQKTPLAERAVALLGLVLVLGVAGLLVYYSVAGDRSPADVRVRPVEVIALEGHHLVRFEAFNRGGETAAQVKVVGTLQDRQGRIMEESTVKLDYVPSHSRQSGGLYFQHDPSQGRLRLQAAGYSDP